MAMGDNTCVFFFPMLAAGSAEGEKGDVGVGEAPPVGETFVPAPKAPAVTAAPKGTGEEEGEVSHVGLMSASGRGPSTAAGDGGFPCFLRMCCVVVLCVVEKCGVARGAAALHPKDSH